MSSPKKKSVKYSISSVLKKSQESKSMSGYITTYYAESLDCKQQKTTEYSEIFEPEQRRKSDWDAIPLCSDSKRTSDNRDVRIAT